eukprot:TRINITY_DN9121_c0_g1_i1.p1 TRINITY_DN9121_c0_g1~~TRINITY_DN9121_c0_g1_i1.p1  ORF type:complete len:239 (-),score=62.10 TRINITY_DN9121_c0_g1_i1:17-733(-)
MELMKAEDAKSKEKDSDKVKEENKSAELQQSQSKDEKVAEEKQPEATQSDADNPPKVSRRGRKGKANIPAETNEPAENSEPLPEPAISSSRSGSLSPTGSIAESMFECLKCGTKIMQTKELVTNHLKRHKFTIDEYIDNYSEEGNSDKFSAIVLWKTNASPEDIKSEPVPQKRGSRKGGRTPVKITPQDSPIEPEKKNEEEDEETKPELKEEKKSSPFKLLFLNSRGIIIMILNQKLS